MARIACGGSRVSGDMLRSQSSRRVTLTSAHGDGVLLGLEMVVWDTDVGLQTRGAPNNFWGQGQKSRRPWFAGQVKRAKTALLAPHQRISVGRAPILTIYTTSPPKTCRDVSQEVRSASPWLTGILAS